MAFQGAGRTADGPSIQPWLALAGELLNNAASTAENVRPVWPSLAKANLNTVLVGVG